jgi:transcriptional regulator with XRE-family HTH domain
MVPTEKGKAFSEWLLDELRVRRMSQRQLAARAGVHHSTICRLTQGDRIPSLATATKLAQVLGSTLGPTSGQSSALADAAPQDTIATVEYALRGDRDLSEAQVRHIMRCYLGERRAAAARRLPVRLVRARPRLGSSLLDPETTAGPIG